MFFCAWACIGPIALALFQLGFGRPGSVASQDDMMFALLATFMASLFTYPMGVVGTIVSWGAVQFGALTPAVSVLLATPFYVAAGYYQWYVLIPGYFRGGADAVLGSKRRRAG